MKTLFFRLLSLSFLLCNLQMGYSQHKGDNQTSKKESKALTPASPAIAELLQSLENATSTKTKADILYELGNAYLGKFKVDSSIYYAQALQQIAINEQYTLGIGKYHLLSAGASFLRNKGEAVMQHLDTAIKIFESAQSDLYLGLCYRLKGRQLGMVSDNTGAQYYYQQSIAYLRRSGDENYLQRALHDYGRNFFFSFELDSAALYLTQALKMAEEMENPQKIFNTATTLGAVYLLANDLDEAGRTLKHALTIHPPDADKIQLRAAWANYTETMILTGQYAEAEKSLEEHDKINKILRDVTGELNEKKLKGLLLYSKGQNKEALLLLEQAYNLKEKLNSIDFDITTIALYLGLCELKEGKTNEAIFHFHHARQLSAKYQFVATAMDANKLLAEAYHQVNKSDSAYYYYRSYTNIKDSIFKNERDKTILELSARYNAEKKEYQIKELEKETKIFSYQLLLKNKTIQAQQLLDDQRSQQFELVTQQAEVNRLRASEQSLALQNKNKEVLQKQKELDLAQKENKLQQALAAKESQNKKLLFGIIIAGLLIGCYGVYRYRQTEKMRKQLALSLIELRQAQEQLIQSEKRNEAENIRQRISRDIHDEVGATLSGVVIFSEIARQKLDTDSNKAAGEYLEHIYSNSKDMLSKMSDIVWAINPKNDSFERIIYKLKSFAVNLCAGKGIELHFTIDDNLFQYSASMQTRRNIYLLIKEAINNAIKYSGAGNIYLSMKNEGDFLEIEIKDDGKGFELPGEFGGNGIANMRARARELGSDLTINSAPGKGTGVSLRFQFHPNEVQIAPIV